MFESKSIEGGIHLNRKKKLLLNTVTSLLNELVTMICGFILPRLIISHFGSSVNGLVSSISHFLAFFALMDMGVGAVVRASLYKPLAEHDDIQISKVLISSRRFFRKIGILLVFYSVGLMVFFPFAVETNMDSISTAVLVGAMALTSIAQFLFGVVYTQLLSADQKSYVRLLTNCILTIVNTVFGVVLINMNASIVAVKLAAAIIMLLKPLLLKLYVDRHYHLDFSLELEGEPIKQKWNGFAQHIATYVLKHSDTLVLTLFSTLENVSIYNVYHLVTNGLQQAIEVLTSGMAALLGNMYARKEEKRLIETFGVFEWIIHTATTFMYSMAAVLVLPFVKVYTLGVFDVNYLVPGFAMLIIFANASYCLRMPYNIMIHAAGHFKETQMSAILEATINVLVSVALVNKYGLVGVAIGTLVAMTYRTIYLACYLAKNILNRSLKYFVQHVVVDVVTIGMIMVVGQWIRMDGETWIAWIALAVKMGGIAVLITGLVNALIYRSNFSLAIQMLKKKKS